MLKDPTPMQHLGFGVTQRDVFREDDEEQGMASGSSFVARALHGHPVAKFFAESAAVLVGMEVAGALIKKGGVKITKRLVRGALEGKQIHANVLQDWRKTQSVMDRLQGIHRQRGQVFRPLAPDALDDFNRNIGDPLQDVATQRAGFFQTREEQLRARQTGEPSNAEWLLRDELQKRLVQQARRLPYELPAAYLMQRGITDRFFNGDTGDQPNWYNPVDVISDFAGQSLKNIGGLMLPFEAGKAGVSQARNRFMTAGMEDATHLTGLRKNVAESSVSLQRLMRLVGHDLGDALGVGINRTEQFSGAMNRAIHESAGMTKNPVEKVDAIVKGVKQRGFWATITDPETRTRNLPAGPIGEFTPFARAFRDAWRDIGADQARRLKPTSFGDTPIEDLTYTLRELEGGRTSGIAREKYIDEYKEMLLDNLQKEGVSRGDALKFVRTVRIKSPPSRGVLEKARRPEEFVEFGAGPHIHEGREFSEYLKERLAGVKGIEKPDVIHDNIVKVLHQTDRRYASQWKRINASVNDQLKQTKAVVLRNAPGALGETRPGYGLFEGPLTPQSHEYLIRQTARSVGIPIQDSTGKSVSANVIRGQLRSRGFDPDDIHSMRGHLVDQKKISKPWNPGGFNIFGMRRLGVEQALSRGFFAERTQMVSKTLQDLEEHHSFSAQQRSMRMKGVYESQSGKVLDTNVFRRKFWRTADLVANEAQVPFIHFRPFQALGWQSFRAMRQAPAISVRGGSGWHPFMDMEGGRLTDSFVWTRKAGIKGGVTRVSKTGRTEEASGLYRVMPTDESTFVGRTMRQAVGDMGRTPAPRPEGQAGWMGRVRKTLAIDDDQPDSFFRLAKRFRGRKKDPRNNMAMARMMLSGDFRGAPDERIMDGASAFINRLRQMGMPPRIIDSLPAKYRNLTQYTTKSGETLNFEDATDASSLLKIVRRMLNEEEAPGILDSANLSEAQRDLLRAARGRIDVRGDRGKALGAILENPVSSGIKSPTIHRRIDMFKQEIYQYLQVRQALTTRQDVDEYFRELLEDVDKLRGAGRITRAETTEFRAALLSTQVQYEGFKHQLAVRGSAGRQATSEEVLRHQFGRLTGTGRGGRLATAAAALEDIAAGRGGSPWREGARKVFGGIAPYEYEGTRYNPFGAGSGTTFVPTFGTAYKRKGWRAVASAMGVNTWNDPQSFSGAGIPVSHGFTRLNRYFSSLSLGLDTTQFNGPLDLYARGMIGRRVLPIVAGGTTAIALDRQIGGLVNERDAEGGRVYSPFFLGMGAEAVVGAQAAAAGVIPGGMTASEKDYELRHGEVPIRKGRFWPLGNTPWKGGNEMYFRPSWYRRMKSGYAYTDQTFGSPMERLAFGYDFSPLRPFDPYRWERKHYKDRPYPVTGEYFTGPWGPVTAALNMTVGRVLKPRLSLHEDEVAANLAGYQAVGESGMAPPTVGAYEMPGGGDLTAIPLSGGVGGGGGGGGGLNTGRPGALAGAGYGSGVGGGGGRGGGSGGQLSVSGQDARNMLLGWNDRYLQYAGATGSASKETQSRISDINATYLSAVGTPRSGGRLPNRVPFGMVMAGAPDQPGEFLTGELGYNLQETLGIYGFAFATAREGLGLGNKDFIPPTPMLASPGTAYGTARTFWDFNLGGLGDSPTPAEGEYANLEFGEIIRRFVPRPRRMNVVNPIVNDMGLSHTWLPASFKMGDPYASIPEGEMRLPGTGYERLHPLAREGNYGPATQFSILGDVAPWSDEYRAMERTMDFLPMTYAERREVETTRKQAEAVRSRFDFTPYEFKGRTPGEMGISPVKFAVGRSIEAIRHSDTYFTKKFLAETTATEDWERNNVYGSTFPQWQNPIEDFLKPLIYRAANRPALGAAAGLAVVSGMMWRTPKTRKLARFVGGAAGLALGAGGFQAGSTILGAAAGAAAGHFWGGGKGAFGAAAGGLLGLLGGEVHDRLQPDYEIGRWMPKRRKEELAVEEYSDILSYVKWKRLYDQANSAGDNYLSANFRRQLQKTMYGADLFDSTPEQLAQAVPKRKREHFMSMLRAPEHERGRILSTAPRLERRLYQAAWGMKVEQRPDLVEYFENHELPAPEWEGWNPASDMESVKLKIIQQQGLDAAQMGYYPQQIQQANLINMPYPNYKEGMGHKNAQSQLQALMANTGVDGTVVSRWSPFPGVQMNFNFAGT